MLNLVILGSRYGRFFKRLGKGKILAVIPDLFKTKFGPVVT